MSTPEALVILRASAALWNRNGLNLQSTETLAQIMDRGSMTDWRALWALQSADAELAQRMLAMATQVPIDTAWFWQAALSAAGHAVPWQVAQGQEL